MGTIARRIQTPRRQGPSRHDTTAIHSPARARRHAVEHLKNALLRAMPCHAEDFADIESGFRALTARRQKPELLRRFFQSWSQTNNSAMTVSGISNLLTIMVHAGETIPDPAALTRAVVSLNRIVDEDLDVTGAIVHSTLFYAMATERPWLGFQRLCQQSVETDNERGDFVDSS